ncbi:COX15/CtaA family protein [Sphingobacterium sp. lm-10]|uniref:COX15/CtaA family protein n=1 Tax=Sphingobacterium sp. lm-10 TaxID=2944904 RepID=UPI00201FBE14|nr:COX15/CtaA family protein [Sphingobacterium sp. lm-10]MCL7988727.1 COX15/CtaA family protein [Sphingobacterium sp. lm-10]
MYPTTERRFVIANRITIIFLFLVIAAGGIVRSTGSGMGCPDWPKCFNRVIPPTDISQLPEGYEQQYIEGRKKKNERFANTVQRFGFHKEAEQIRTDLSILVHEEFNAAKTWTEYINRLVGVIVGFCMLATAFFSLQYRETKPAIAIWSVLNLFVVVIQAWLGSIVVSTNLMPWVITIHMVLALIILAIAIYTFYLATTRRNSVLLVNNGSAGIKWLSLLSLLVLFIQIILGTEVRELVDVLRGQGVVRSGWIDAIGTAYDNHRILGYVTFGITIVVCWMVRNKFSVNNIQSKFALIILILAVIQMGSGIVLARFALPPYMQTTHLVVASLFFGAQYYLMLLMTKAKL